MKINPFFLLLLTFTLAFQACGDDDDMNSSEEELITNQNVRAVFNFLPPSGYESTFYTEDLPSSVEAGYTNTTTDQNIYVGAAEDLTGEVIDVTDTAIEISFLNPVNIEESEVNGTTVYQSMEESQYRVVIFRGQYLFNVIVQNDPDPTEAEAEAALFVELITEAMTTF